MVPLLFIPSGATGFLWPRAVLSALLMATAMQAWSAPLSPVAEPATPMRRPDPLDPKSPVPALVYRASLPPAGAAATATTTATTTANSAATNPTATNDKPIPWRQANEAVARIGGWRAYAREAQQAPPASPAAPSASAAAMPSAASPGPSGASGPRHQYQP